MQSKEAYSSGYGWIIGLVLLCLALSTGCANNTLAQGRKEVVAPKPSVNSNGADKQVSPFAHAFPPTAPLLCPRDKAVTKGRTYVRSNGTRLTYNGKVLKLYGYTFYPALEGGASAWRKPDFPRYIEHILDMGARAGQTMIRPTDFWDKRYKDRVQDDIMIWKNMDYMICAAQKRGVFVNMDISAFAWFLLSQGQSVYDKGHWKAFLHAVGRHYSLQSQIAFYSILGEPTAPKNHAEMNALLDFYRVTTTELRNADGGHHLITAGGFNHMEDESTQLPWWRMIYALPTNDIGAFKTYSQRDLEFIPTIAKYAQKINKPIFEEEFGMPQKMGDAHYTGESYNNIQLSRAQFFEAVYSKGEAHKVAGFVFWNMGCEMKAGGYEIGPKTPGVWRVIRKHAPRRPAVSVKETSLCTSDPRTG